MEDKNILSCVAIAAITVLEVAAMLNGIDGAVFSVVVAVISGLAGYKIRDMIKK